jgi:maltokinase
MSDAMVTLDEKRIADWLPQQRWFGAKDRTISAVRVDDVEVLRDDWPLLVRVLAQVDLEGVDTPSTYQLLVGVRRAVDPMEFLQTHEEAILGEVETAAGDGVAYDATFDGELGLVLLPLVVAGETAGYVRPLGAEQSNTSLVYDDRIIVKVFRHLADGPNPDVEVTTRLADLGFAHVAEPLGTVEHDGRNLMFAQRFLAGGVDGWSLALTSLRDLFASADTTQLPVIDPDAPPTELDPGDAGGDFAAESERLGAMTAALHAAMADAFGRAPADLDAWAAPMRAQVTRTRHPDLDDGRVRGLLDELGSVRDPGPAIRIHGDYHLGQVMRTDGGWYVLDFEGEPARPLAERQASTTPLKDVAGMLRSFHYAAQVGLRERGGLDDGASVELADRWEARNREAFLDGYLPPAIEAGLVPETATDLRVVLAAFELDKAVYELAYEQSHRPEWVAIPLAAISRLVEGTD